MFVISLKFRYYQQTRHKDRDLLLGNGQNAEAFHSVSLKIERHHNQTFSAKTSLL